MKPLIVEIEPSQPHGFAVRVAACAGTGPIDNTAVGLEPIRTWLLGGNAAAPVSPALPALPARGAGFWMRHRFGRERDPDPRGALLLKTGPLGWASPDLKRRLVADPTLVPVAVVEHAWIEAFPEYARAETVAAWHGGVAAMARLAQLALVPSQEAGRLLAQAFARQGGPAPPIVPLAAASGLAGTPAPRPDPDLAGVAFLLVACPIEARSNVLLLLTVWRDLVQAGVPVPKLVLAGRRGDQIEEIKPMLDWNESLRPHVREAGALSAEALTTLMTNAAGLLVPGFAADDAALACEALALGIPVVASDIPLHREVLDGRARLIDPIDGCGWRQAVAALAGPGRLPRPAAPLHDREDFGQRLRAILSAL